VVEMKRCSFLALSPTNREGYFLKAAKIFN